MKRKLKNSIIIVIVLIILILNMEKIKCFYYILKSYSDNTKSIVEKEYNMEVTIMMENKKNHVYEGVEKRTLRKKYVIKVYGEGEFILYADEGVDISTAQIIAEEKGFPPTPIRFQIKDSFSGDMTLADNLFWYFVNNKGKVLYISFANGKIIYSDKE